MAKITNDGLTRSGTGCLYSCTHMATVGVKELTRRCLTSSDFSAQFIVADETEQFQSLLVGIYLQAHTHIQLISGPATLPY